MDRINRIRVILFVCLTALISCGEYGTREPYSPPDSGTSEGSIKTGYLVDKSDWILRVEDELIFENRSSPSSGRQIAFDGQSIFVETGSKIIVWRCDTYWKYREVFLDSERFRTPNFVPSCVV